MSVHGRRAAVCEGERTGMSATVVLLRIAARAERRLVPSRYRIAQQLVEVRPVCFEELVHGGHHVVVAYLHHWSDRIPTRRHCRMPHLEKLHSFVTAELAIHNAQHRLDALVRGHDLGGSAVVLLRFLEEAKHFGDDRLAGAASGASTRSHRLRAAVNEGFTCGPRAAASRGFPSGGHGGEHCP